MFKNTISVYTQYKYFDFSFLSAYFQSRFVGCTQWGPTVNYNVMQSEQNSSKTDTFRESITYEPTKQVLKLLLLNTNTDE